MKKFIIFIALFSFFACSADNAALINTVWELKEMRGKEIDRENLAANNSLTLMFMKQGDAINVGAIGDSNTLGGSVKLDELKKTLSIQIVRSTKMRPKNEALEEQYKSMLAAITNYAIKGNKLIFKDKDNKTIAKFTKGKEEKI